MSGDGMRTVEHGLAMERFLCEAFAEALGVPRVAPDDHFFDLGGHSLLVMRVVADIEAGLGIHLAPSAIFDHPTASRLTHHLAAIELEAAPMRAASTSTAPDAPSALSPLQRGMWFLDQGVGRHAAYLLPEAWQIRGPLDVDSLRCALQAIVNRHAALSTRYFVVDGTPRQTVVAPEPFVLPLHDLRHLERAERESACARLVVEEAHHPFDLTQDTLLRGTLIHLEDEQHVLLLTTHHLAADAWSQHVLRRELADLYRAYCGGTFQDSSMEQRRDDAACRVREVDAERRLQLLTYWRRQLGDLPVLELPTDRPRTASWNDAGGELEFDIAPALVSRLEALASSADVTLQMLLLAAYEVVIGRYSGQADFGIACFVSDRPGAALDSIGLFVNTIVIRAGLQGTPTFRALLAGVRQTSLDGYDHRDLPFDTLVADLRVDRHEGPNPLARVAFQHLPIADAPPSLEGLEVSRLPSATDRVRFELELTIRKDGNALRALVGYSTALWDRESVVRVAEYYQTVLSAIVEDPDASLADLARVSDGHRDEQLVEWSGVSRWPGRQGVVHELFDLRASAAPDSVALESGNDRVTYRQLHARATIVASRLRAAGVIPGDVVAIHASSLTPLAEAMLGILKAGGTYMPLDTAHPPERLLLMLRLARTKVVLTTSTPPEWLAGALPVLDLSTASAVAASSSAPVPITPDAAAYIMFTSGSTGQPKGVAVAHRGITRLVLDADYVDFAPDDGVAFASNPAFDAATFEIWGALLNGARLIEVDRQTLLSPAQLADAIRSHGITVMFLTAALFQQIASMAPQTFTRLRCLIVGGDVVDPSAAAAVLEAGAPGRLVNGYGPTENTTFSATYRIPADADRERTLPIGRPVAGSTCYVLDERRDLLPIGAVGELYVGGSGLSLGYVNDGLVTAERFVEHPFDRSERLYRTGDRARWRWDGQLEFLGRADRQVKLRGHRIELEEIEHVLSSHEAVASCAVVLDKTRVRDPRLIGYVVLRSGCVIPMPLLIEHLRRRLPAYMIPAAVIELPALPLTANGKLDRPALADLAPGAVDGAPRLEAAGAPDHAVTRMERLVASAFQDVLHLDRVPLDGDFFDLGGDSLGSLKLVRLLDAIVARAVSVTDVFAHPTVRELAIMMTQPKSRTLPRTLVEVRRGLGKLPIYFPPGALGEVVIGSAISDALPEDVPLYAFRDPLDDSPRAESMEAMAAAFCADLMAFQPEGPVGLAGYSFGGLLAYEMARQLKAAGREIRLLVIFDTGPDLSSGGGVRESAARAWLCLKNVPMWIYEDLICSFDRDTPGRLWRSVKNQIRTDFTIRRSAAPGVVPRVDHLFDVSEWSPALYAHVDNNIKILGAFQYRPYDGDVVLFRARARPLLHAHTPDLGWRSLARSVRVIRATGNHHTLMLPPHIHGVARSFREVVERA